MDTIYFDHAATTPLDERVLEAMLPYMTENYGNANSAHHLGQKAKVVVEDAREQIAALIHAEPSEIVFTSGGTESDNAVIKGVLAASKNKSEVVSSLMEHHAVLHPVEMAKIRDFTPVFVGQGKDGIITAAHVQEKLNEQVALVSLMHVNNELGTINPIKEIAEACHQARIPFHTDAVQSLGKIPLDVHDLGVDFLSGSAHKIYGPKGVGLMYVRNGSKWLPWLTGGSQERARRGGTTNVPGVIGLAKALDLAISELDTRTAHFNLLRSHLLHQLNEKLTACRYRINGSEERTVPHIINLSFTNKAGKGIDGEMLLLNLDIEGICVSNGSACTSGAMEPSHVLTALGLNDETAKSSIRLSFGKNSTPNEVSYLVETLNAVLTRMFKLVS